MNSTGSFRSTRASTFTLRSPACWRSCNMPAWRGKPCPRPPAKFSAGSSVRIPPFPGPAPATVPANGGTIRRKAWGDGARPVADTIKSTTLTAEPSDVPLPTVSTAPLLTKPRETFPPLISAVPPLNKYIKFAVPRTRSSTLQRKYTHRKDCRQNAEKCAQIAGRSRRSHLDIRQAPAG